MSGGIIGDEVFDKYTPDVDWTEITLSTPLVQPPGSGWIYSSPGSHLLSAILVQATGQSVLDFARERLFRPLGISTEPAAEPVLSSMDLPLYDATPGFGWSTDPQGLHLGLADLKITAPEMVKLGQLALDDGHWNGQQVISEAWVHDSTSALVPTDFQEYDYGYQWRAFDAGGYPALPQSGVRGN